MNTEAMSQRELEAERDTLEALRSSGELTPLKAKRLMEIRGALATIERSSRTSWQ